MTGVGARVLCALLYAVACSLAAAQNGGSTVPGQSSTVLRDTECCEIQPDWDTAVTLRCVCDRDRTKIHLGADDIPSSVESIAISQAWAVYIHDEAIHALPHLKNFTIENSNTLNINSDGLKIKRKTELQLLRISAIHDVNMYDSAVSGYWESATNITIQNITSLFLEANSFSHQSTSPGPTLEVADIELFKLRDGALSGPITLMSVRRVKNPMSTCSLGTFGKRILHLKLNSVTINEVNPGCFEGSGALARLSIQSCDLRTVHSRAFLGKIDVVEIDGSKMGQVHVNGFDVRVTRLSMTDSWFDSLTQGSLKITAQDSITLDHVWVKHLEQNALVSLRTARDTSVPTAGLIVRDLHVIIPGEGSLAFDAAVSVCLSDLNIGISQSWPCPTEPLTRRLVGSSDGRPLSAAQLQVHRQLHRPAVCPADRHEPPRAAQKLPQPAVCPADHREPPHADETGPSCNLDPAAATGLVLTELHLVAAALAPLSVALLIALAWSLCTRRVPLPGCLSRSAARTRKPHLGLRAQRSDGAGAGQSARAAAALPDRFSEEYGYSTVQEQAAGESRGAGAEPVSGRYQDAATAAAASKGCPPAHTDLYAEVRESGLLRSRGKNGPAQRHSDQSLTVYDSNSPTLPPMTLERLQLVRDHQEEGHQESVYEELGYQEAGDQEAGYQESVYEEVGH